MDLAALLDRISLRRCRARSARPAAALMACAGVFLVATTAVPEASLLPGVLKREVYDGVQGGQLEALFNHPDYPEAPSAVGYIPTFEAPSQVGDNYGQRISGFLLPPVSGEYVFYLCSDDQSRLSLSVDANRYHATRIAEEPAWSPPRTWVGGPVRTGAENISAPIRLEAGEWCYVEAIMVEGGGGDHLAVAWQRPGDPVPANGSAPIPGEYLASWDGIGPPPPPGRERELHVVGVYSGTAWHGGTSRDHELGNASVVVDRPDSVVTLVLSAYEPVAWQVEVREGTRIEKVILCGHYPQTVSGVAPEFVVSDAEAALSGLRYIGYAVDTGTFYESVPLLYALTGMEIAGFQGGYQAAFPAPFVIDAVQQDPRLAVGFPAPLSPEQLPDLFFELAFLDADSSAPAATIRHVQYGPNGPLGTDDMLPGVLLTADADGRDYFGSEGNRLWRVDSHTGERKPWSADALVPPLSWPTGMTVDSLRNRVILASMGGEGFLYAYDCAGGNWSTLASLRERDIGCLVYHAAQDALYGATIVSSEGGRPRLFRFTADGEYTGDLPLPFLPFGTGPGGYRTELASVGEFLVLFYGARTPHVSASRYETARMYIIDPGTGDVLLGYHDWDAPTYVTLKWPDPTPVTYGAALGGAQLNAVASVPGSFAYDPPSGTVLEAGVHTLHTRFRPSLAGSDWTVTAQVQLVVHPAPLLVRADDLTRPFGRPNPPLTASYEGLVAGDTPDALAHPVVLSTDAAVDSPPGMYPIFAGAAADPNYIVTFVAGTLTIVGGEPRPGSVDPGFRADVPDGRVLAMALDAEGRLVVGGTFRRIHDVARNHLARLLPNGDADPAFGETSFLESPVRALLSRSESQTVVACDTIVWPYRVSYGVGRLNRDGGVDTIWGSPFAAGSVVTALATLESGFTLAGGLVQTSGDVMRFRIVRLLWHCEPDSLFDVSLDGMPRALLVQPDGRILVAGDFTAVNEHPCRGLARLLPDGEVDPDFVVPTEILGALHCLALQPDGRILAGGRLQSSRAGLARFHADGRFDPSFAAGLLPGDRVSAIVVQPDGKVLVGGDFALIEGKVQAGIARLGRDGRLDRGFDPGSGIEGVDAEVCAIVLQPDGMIVIGGAFDRVGGIPRRGVARLYGGEAPSPAFVARTLPWAYLPERPVQVRLDATPPASVSAYAVEDQPPAGWSVSAISHDGVLDPVHGRVKFGPFFDHEARLLTYAATPPAGVQGEQWFTGAASADGGLTPVAGDAVIMPAPAAHPADTPSPDFRLIMAEVTAYAASWKRGDPWPEPPQTIPMDFLTRAAFLWRRGEMYVFSPAHGAPPLCWVSRTEPADEAAGSAAPASKDASPASSATIGLPEIFLSGRVLPVTVDVAPAPGAAAYALEIRCPAGCGTVEAGAVGSWDRLAQVIRYGPFLDDQPRRLSFAVTPSQDAAGRLTFDGSLSVDGYAIGIPGATTSRAAAYLSVLQTGDGPLPMVLHAEGDPNAAYVVEASSDLHTWRPVAESGGTATFPAVPDPQAAAPWCFYRLRVLPPVGGDAP